MFHGACASQHAVGQQLCGRHKIEGRDYFEEHNSRVHGVGGSRIDKYVHGGFAEEEVEDKDRHAQGIAQQETALVTLLYPFHLACADVLGGEVGHAVAESCEAGDNKVIELYRCGVACHNTGAEAVDDALDKYVSYRYKALLKYAGNGDSRYPVQKVGAEKLWLFIAFYRSEPFEKHQKGEHTAYALAQKCRPCHTADTHVKGGDEENVHEYVGT